jgi:hypothetical protein
LLPLRIPLTHRRAHGDHPAIIKFGLSGVFMATAPPIQGPKRILHARGTWSARDDRTPSAVWLGLLWLGMILGFGVDFSRFLFFFQAEDGIRDTEV